MAKAKKRKKIYLLRKVDQKMLDDILKDISEGAPRKYAAEANGITETTFHNLVRQGLHDMKHRKPSLESLFVIALRRTELSEIKLCRQLIRGSSESHKGAQWTLEHAYWRSFSNNAPAKELAEEIDEMKASLSGDKHEQANSSKAQKNPEK